MLAGAYGERHGQHYWVMATAERDKLFTPDELSRYLDVPVATLYDWRYRGGGPPGFRLGRHLRYRKADVDRWIDDRIQASAST